MRQTAIVIVTFMLVGCAAAPNGGYKQSTGTLLGAAGGAAAGAQFGAGSGRVAATTLGTLLGAAIGSDVGASLDRADAAYARSYLPNYYASSPPTYAPAPTPVYSAYPGYAVPSTMRWAPAPSGLVAGCQRVGNGIWCEQSNGTFQRH